MTTTQRIVEIGIDARKAETGGKRVENAFNRTAKATKNARDEQGRYVKQTEKTTKVTGRLALGLGGLVGGFAALNALRSSIRTVTSFEETIVSVGQVARASTDELAALRQEARELGGTTRFTATDAGEGLLFLARAGFNVNESLGAIGSTLDLATAGNLALGDAADIASNVLSQFGLRAEETVRIVDTLVNVSNNANTSVGQLAEALKFAGPVAGALGRDVEETAAALGVLGNSGIQASLAGTNLRGILSTLLEPTGKGKKALDELNIAIADLDPNTKSLVEIFGTLEDAGLTASQAVALFGRRNAAAALILRDAVDEIENLIQAQENGRGAAAEFSEALNDTLGGSFRSLASAVESVVINLGDLSDGTLKGFVDGLTDAVRFVSRLTDSTGEWVRELRFARGVIEGLTISLLAGFGAQALLSISTYTTAVGALTKALGALAVVVKRNPIFFGVSFGVFAISQLNNINNLFREQRSLLDDLRRKEIDLQLARASFEGASGPINLALGPNSSPEIIEGAFARLADTFRTQAEFFASDVNDSGGVALEDIISFVPERLQAKFSEAFDVVENVAEERRQRLLDSLNEQLDSAFEQRSRFEGFGDTSAFIDNERQIQRLQIAIRELNDTPLEITGEEAADALLLFADRTAEVGTNTLKTARDLQSLNESTKAVTQSLQDARDGFGELNRGILDQLISLGKTGTELEKQQLLLQATGLAARQAASGDIIGAWNNYADAIANINRLIEAKNELESRERQSAALDTANDTISRLEFQEQALRNFSRSASDNQIIMSGSAAVIEEFGADSEEAARKVKELEAAVDGLENARRLRAVAEGIGQAFADAFSDVIFEAQSVEDAIEGLVKNTAKLIFDQLVAQQIASFVARIAGAGFGAGAGGGFKNGGVIGQGGVIPFASGGIVDRPTRFPMNGGRTGLMGEAGPEAIVPLPNSRAIPVEMKGGGGTTVINQTVNVETPDAGSFDRSKNQIGRNLRRQLQRSV